jgi:hypothetical protein
MGVIGLGFFLMAPKVAELMKKLIEGKLDFGFDKSDLMAGLNFGYFGGFKAAGTGRFGAGAQSTANRLAGNYAPKNPLTGQQIKVQNPSQGNP